MTDFFLLRPLWLIGTVISLVAIYYLFQSASSRSQWWDVMDEHVAKHLIINRGGNKFLTPINILLMLIASICLALAGPGFERQIPDELKDKASVIVLLANGDSMYAGDITPNRNRIARQKITRLSNILTGSQLGLVAYAKSAHQVVPLTSDPDFLSLYLDELEPKLMPARELKVTGLQDALGIAATMKTDATYPASVLIIADQLDTLDIDEILDMQTQNQVDIKVLAMGTEGGGPLRFSGRTQSAGTVDTQMNVSAFAALKQKGIATTGVTQNDDDINWIADGIKSSVAMTNNHDSKFSLKDSGYLLAWIFIPLCLPLFRKNTWLFSFAPVVLSFGLSVPSTADANTWDQLWWSADQQGQKAVEQGDYQEAADVFEDPYLKGWSYYQAGNYPAAEVQFRQVNDAKGYFYLANSLAQQQKYTEALKFYGKAVEITGRTRETDHNSAIVKSLMEKTNKVSANKREISDQGRILLQVGGKGNVRKKQHLHEDPLNYSEEELNVWLNRVKSSPDELLRTKFELQSQEKMLDEN